MKKFLEVAGRTEDTSMPVVRGVHRATASFGVPLDVAVAFLAERGYVVDWEDFVRGTMEDGASPNTVLSKVREAMVDFYPSVVERSEFDERLSKLVSTVAREKGFER